MAKAKAQENELKVDAKIGRLTIESQHKSYTTLLYLCRCECGQLVPATGSNLRDKNARKQCVNCDQRDFAKNFAVNDVVLIRRSHYAFLLNEQAIVAGFADVAGKHWIDVEWRGHLYSHEPRFLENTGVNFYGKTNNRSIKNKT